MISSIVCVCLCPCVWCLCRCLCVCVCLYRRHRHLPFKELTLNVGHLLFKEFTFSLTTFALVTGHCSVCVMVRCTYGPVPMGSSFWLQRVVWRVRPMMFSSFNFYMSMMRSSYVMSWHWHF